MNESADFETYRPLMFSIAYRMLGSMTEAEDILQEAYLRFQATEPEEIRSPKAFLSTVVTRLCLTHLQSAQYRHETYVGPWLPEPVLTQPDDHDDPARQAELHDSISIAFLMLLEELTPLERAIFLLREVFDYEYAEIADILGKEEAACRQLFSRARKHLAERRPRFKPDPEAHQQILNEFIQAITSGEIDGLMHLLADDVTLWTDGGGKARGAATHPLHGREAVARFMLGSIRFAPQPLRSDLAEVNGQMALILRAGEEPRVVVSIVADQGRISEVHIVGNPDKLHWIGGSSNKIE